MEDVIIIGGGPLGFINTLGLAQAGVRVSVIVAEPHIILEGDGKLTGAFIFSCRLPAARAIATRGPLLCQIRRRHRPARKPPFGIGRNGVTSGQSTEAERPTDSVNLSLDCLRLSPANSANQVLISP